MSNLVQKYKGYSIRFDADDCYECDPCKHIVTFTRDTPKHEEAYELDYITIRELIYKYDFPVAEGDITHFKEEWWDSSEVFANP